MANRREYWKGGHWVVITRRFLNKETGRMRVRVTVKTMAGEVKGTKFQDYDDMHRGDAVFSSLCDQYAKMGQKGNEMDTSTLPMRHEIYGTDMEARVFDPAGDLNGSTVTLWASPNGWSVTVQYRSPYTGYALSSLVPLGTNQPEADARELFQLTILERNGTYAAEARRLAL